MGQNEFATEQEAFWAGEFGTGYIARNQSDQLLAANLDFFAKALRQTGGVSSCLEFGANIGMNLKALNLLFPGIDASAIEINDEAVQQLGKVIPETNIHHQSILDYVSKRTFDLALIKGVLIHMDPEVLPEVYDTLVSATARYLLVAEYYDPTPVAIPYRGHEGRLFKRDFAGEIMDRHSTMQLCDYGFVYHRDPLFPQDDITWFLMEKR
ncbi:pseudaminic acid biosynthesis-associated methylase [Sphingomonas sp. Leaf343]|uniref:pseudaminic acid biosynthesis-associated methylase n=1 Tax=Sphingomonas sp. Leaf343 TaxID=1736345 RepID=UPI0006FEEEF5|nr:pseudaminic acid biosynthesis-associated methylase [Sphingomonas sp. Leaf343]KQR80230.1 pseudaminic acid biosynthesis-associated methylase [Sphingomonas sp. Leaf343]